MRKKKIKIKLLIINLILIKIKKIKIKKKKKINYMQKIKKKDYTIAIKFLFRNILKVLYFIKIENAI